MLNRVLGQSVTSGSMVLSKHLSIKTATGMERRRRIDADFPKPSSHNAKKPRLARGYSYPRLSPRKLPPDNKIQPELGVTLGKTEFVCDKITGL